MTSNASLYFSEKDQNFVSSPSLPLGKKDIVTSKVHNSTMQTDACKWNVSTEPMPRKLNGENAPREYQDAKPTLSNLPTFAQVCSTLSSKQSKYNEIGLVPNVCLQKTHQPVLTNRSVISCQLTAKVAPPDLQRWKAPQLNEMQLSEASASGSSQNELELQENRKRGVDADDQLSAETSNNGFKRRREESCSTLAASHSGSIPDFPMTAGDGRRANEDASVKVDKEAGKRPRAVDDDGDKLSNGETEAKKVRRICPGARNQYEASLSSSRRHAQREATARRLNSRTVGKTNRDSDWSEVNVHSAAESRATSREPSVEPSDVDTTPCSSTRQHNGLLPSSLLSSISLCSRKIRAQTHAMTAEDLVRDRQADLASVDDMIRDVDGFSASPSSLANTATVCAATTVSMTMVTTTCDSVVSTAILTAASTSIAIVSTITISTNGVTVSPDRLTVLPAGAVTDCTTVTTSVTSLYPLLSVTTTTSSALSSNITPDSAPSLASSVAPHSVTVTSNHLQQCQPNVGQVPTSLPSSQPLTTAMSSSSQSRQPLNGLYKFGTETVATVIPNGMSLVTMPTLSTIGPTSVCSVTSQASLSLQTSVSSAVTGVVLTSLQLPPASTTSSTMNGSELFPTSLNVVSSVPSAISSVSPPVAGGNNLLSSVTMGTTSSVVSSLLPQSTRTMNVLASLTSTTSSSDVQPRVGGFAFPSKTAAGFQFNFPSTSTLPNTTIPSPPSGAVSSAINSTPYSITRTTPAVSGFEFRFANFTSPVPASAANQNVSNAQSPSLSLFGLTKTTTAIVQPAAVSTTWTLPASSSVTNSSIASLFSFGVSQTPTNQLFTFGNPQQPTTSASLLSQSGMSTQSPVNGVWQQQLHPSSLTVFGQSQQPMAESFRFTPISSTPAAASFVGQTVAAEQVGMVSQTLRQAPTIVSPQQLTGGAFGQMSELRGFNQPLNKSIFGQTQSVPVCQTQATVPVFNHNQSMPAFGQPSAASGATVFGHPVSQALPALFGQSQTGAVFVSTQGSASAPSQAISVPMFGQQINASTPAFSPFQSNPGPFGQTLCTSSQFSNMQNNSSMFGPSQSMSMFGQNQGIASMFGASGQVMQTPSFGQPLQQQHQPVTLGGAALFQFGQPHPSNQPFQFGGAHPSPAFAAAPRAVGPGNFNVGVAGRSRVTATRRIRR